MRKLVVIVAMLGLVGCTPAKVDNYRTYPQCVTEDQETGPCYWNAHTRGNGQGHSFYVDQHGTRHFVSN